MATIGSWSVADFKSLGAATLRLPRLTVLAGANSSGKSSVLQSMLLLAQSMTRGGRIVMNGQLVRLGEPSHVIREGQSAVEFRFEVTHGGLAATAEPPRAAKFNVAVSLVPADDGTSMSPSSFEVIDAYGKLIVSATSERMRAADIEAFSHSFSNQDLSFLKLKIIDGRKAPNRMYVGFVGLVPMLLARHIDPGVIRRQLGALLDNILATERLNIDVASELTQLVSKKKFFKEFGIEKTPPGNSSRQAQSMSALWTMRDFNALEPEVLKTLVGRFVEGRAEHEWAVIGPGLSFFGHPQRMRHYYFDGGAIETTLAEEHATSLTYMGAFASALEIFGNRIQYLGPLRDEPRVVQGAWDERVPALPVGIRGELTAEILTRERNSKINFQDWDGTPRVAALPDAVALWCEYFGIGDKIEVHDHGKLGRGVELQVDGFSRDLTQIGVGASQLLPILVASLAAEASTIILIEQPELHLHPSVQSRLADFFLFARPDVRFIVETHSEYLVTRIRRRIAEEVTTPSHVEVMFAERVGGATQVRSLSLTAGGDFDEWPDGFFDAQEVDTRFIIRALAARVAKEES